MPASKQRPVHVMVRGEHTVKTTVPAEVTRLKARGYREQAKPAESAPANVGGGSDKLEQSKPSETKVPEAKASAK